MTTIPKTGRPRENPEFCVEKGCSLRAVCKSRCDKHYRSWRRDTSGVPRAYTRNQGNICSAEGCSLPAERKGLCSTHYARVRRNGDLKLRRAPNGAGHLDDRGYFITTKNGKTQGEHRHVMEKKLDRELFEDETVHHKNGNRSDNQQRNLELRVGLHPQGQSIPDQIEWAETILARYRPERLRP